MSASSEAYLPLRLIGSEVIECLIDTGFNGQIVLPRKIIDRLNIAVIGCEVFEMFGGQLVTAEIALVDVEWLAEKHTVQVIISEGEDALIGTDMFAGTQLTIDYVARIVTVSTAQ